MTTAQLPKPAKGARVVGYRPLTGRPTNPDGSLRLELIYERPRVMGVDLSSGPDLSALVTGTVQADGSIRIDAIETAKPRRRIVGRGVQGSLL